MTTNLYTDCYNWIVPELPMCPLPMVQNAIRDAVIELCERALLWRQEIQEVLVLGPTTTTTTAAQVAGDTVLQLADCTHFADGMTITVQLDDPQTAQSALLLQAGVVWRGHVLGAPSATTGPGTINLDGPLNDIVDVGATVTLFVDRYPITLPTGTAIAKVVQAWLNDNPIDPISQDDLDNEFNNTAFGWVGVNWRTDVNLPTRYYMPDDTTIALALAPSMTGNLRLNAALKPTRGSTTFPNWIFERYIETIAHGAKAKLMLVPKKPYFDAQAGQYHMQMFYNGIAEARVRMARANTRAPLRNHTVYHLR